MLNLKPVGQVVAAIQALDLGPIKFKLMDPEEGQGWSREYVESMEIAYKRFLTLLVKYPDRAIAPTKDIDKFWHGHILDTMKYAEDCQRVFGFFLHHFPYFGMRGEQDAKNLAEAGDAMAALYESEFGEPMPHGRQKGHVSPAWCYAASEPAGARDAAWCYAATEPANAQDAAWCYATSKRSKAEEAASEPEKANDPAWCYASARSRNIDVVTRPTLT